MTHTNMRENHVSQIFSYEQDLHIPHCGDPKYYIPDNKIIHGDKKVQIIQIYLHGYPSKHQFVMVL